MINGGLFPVNCNYLVITSDHLQKRFHGKPKGRVENGDIEGQKTLSPQVTQEGTSGTNMETGSDANPNHTMQDFKLIT
jgi:hypothetical protein